jgi:signal transduction histidine kinase
MQSLDSKNNNLLKWIIFLPVIGVLVTSFTLTNIYINSINSAYENEVLELEKNYLKTVKQKIKNRINNISNTIDRNYDYQVQESKQTVKHFVNLGHSIIETIYENNKHKTKEQIYKTINNQMKNIRFFDNHSGYFFIYDAKNAISISLPATPSLVGKSLRNLKDKNNKSLFYSYKKVMEKDGEGFDTWYWNKPSSILKTKKIGYVKLFEPLNIVVGTALYEEDIKQTISKHVVKIIEELKFQDDGYIFIIDNKGKSISHKNKKILNIPLEKLSPTTQKNVKGIMDKLNNKNETFIEYTQDKKILDNIGTSKKISYIQYNQKLNWIIGTGLYTDNLNTKIKEKKQALEQRQNDNTNLIVFISITLSFIIVLILMSISKKIQNTILYYSNELNSKNAELKILNTNLEEKINKQVKTQREKDLFFNQQSKLIAMGEMLGNIAHQWRQPLSAICTVASGIQMRKKMDIITDEQIHKDLDNIINSTEVLSQTIDDFREFHSNKKEKVEFEIQDAIEKVLNLISANLKSKDISVQKEIQNIKCSSYQNELVQVLLNIINNAKDALLEIEIPKYIFIQTKEKDGNLIIEIYDNAGGINKDIIERVFEPYFTTKFKSKGTGIGLYMSKNIIENSLKGTMKVENYSFEYKDNNYTGAKFTLALPIKD